MQTNVLLVEDDARIREALALALADEDFTVVQAASGEEGLAILETISVQVVLLDLMLPGVDGLGVCHTLRAQGDLPIIVITARSDTADVIAGLEAGADDYVTKPLVASELAARIRALLRRHRQHAVPETGEAEDRLCVGELEIFPTRGVVRRAGVDVHLTRTEFRLLVELSSAAGRIVSREELLERVWGYDYYGDTRLLDVHIRRLRRKIESNPDSPDVVLTVRGAGYKTRES
ncbi:MAG TPA: response regulator transcription factor [Pseudonocardia sp.]|jgi:DNA-binding response OmpR family regulator|nr:response regulator transcription factor [Pseudonocardia sp.]